MELSFSLSASGLTDIGLQRPNNEDNFLFHSKAGYFLVADGMGGAVAGEVASRIFTETAQRSIPLSENRTEEKAIELIKSIFLEANAKIRDHIRVISEHEGMGCTADLLIFHINGFVLGHVGDSRTYRMRNGHLTRLTKDHSLIQDHIDKGLISSEEARGHRLRNVISKAVGVSEKLEVDIVRGKFLRGDLFLLCSDGLSDMVSDNSIEKILLKSVTLNSRTILLLEQALASGGRDNITIVLVGVE